MNAAVLHALGQPPRFEPFPEPVPGDGEVLVHVRAAALKPVDKQMAAGSHYASPRVLPAVCGTDGVGRLDDGTRVFFGGARAPYGTMAERTVVPRVRCRPLPDNLDDVAAAAVFNPGISAWASLTWRAKLAPGETVIILGATGTTGKLAVRTAKLLGAGRIVAAGRNPQALSALPALGADATISLDQPDTNLTNAFAREAGGKGYDVVIDYLWGRPTEALIAALSQHSDMALRSNRVRLVEVGESAGPAISLPAGVLRSSGLEILGSGTGTVPPREIIEELFNQVVSRAASGELRVDTATVLLADIEAAWQRQDPLRRRMVIIP